ECSSTLFAAVRAASKELGYLDRVRAALSFENREMVDGLHREPWWPGERFIDFLLALEAVGGPGTSRRAGVLASHQSMGKLARPLTGALLAFSRAPLESLLSRFSTFAGLGIRGVTASWVKTGDRVGRATVLLPRDTNPILGEQWYGLFDVGFSLARQGSIVKVTIEPRSHVFDLQW
ncbi:MAG TPA: hypothetical protein VGD87_10890, partial [Archangium sp.]